MNIFEKDNSKRFHNTTIQKKIGLLACRKPFRVKQIFCPVRKVSFQEGLSRIEDELDIVRFVKQQKYLQIMLETLFNSSEMFLLKKNKKLILNQKEINNENSHEERFSASQIEI